MTIAFLDHHLDNWHAKLFLGLLRERGHEVVAYESHPSSTDWCLAHAVARHARPEAAVEAADAVMVLAPDDIEHHPALLRAALPFGKPTFVDKLLAPSVAQAVEALDLAYRHGTPLTAASSLRHAAELEDALGAMGGPPEEGVFSGYGTWDRYGVHTVAMALRALRTRVARIAAFGTGYTKSVGLEFTDGRRASLSVVAGTNASAAFPWRFALRRGEEYEHGTVARFEEFYRGQLDATLAAFSDRSSMDPYEMLDTVRVLEIVPGLSDAVWVEA